MLYECICVLFYFIYFLIVKKTHYNETAKQENNDAEISNTKKKKSLLLRTKWKAISSPTLLLFACQPSINKAAVVITDFY